MSLVGSSGPYTRPKSVSSWLQYEVNPEFTRSMKSLLKASTVASGQVLGKISVGSAGALTATPGASVSGTGGTPGNGVVGTPTADVKAKRGEWTIVFIEPVNDLGTFQVFDPDGNLAKPATGTVGTAYNGVKGLNFTIADGSSNFVSGDRIPVVVAAANATGDDKYVPLDLAASNGAEIPAAISVYDYEAPDDEDIDFLVLDGGPSLVNIDELIYPVGATTDEKAAIVVALAALGIKETPGNG